MAAVDVPMSAYRSNGGTLVPLTALRQNILHYDNKRIQRYVDLMQKGHKIDPIEVSDDAGGVYTVWQGHHRKVASERCGFTHIPVVVIQWCR